jgi:hypothetical protein
MNPMSGPTHPLVPWAEFLLLSERPENAQRYELHDGEVVVVPPARPRHLKIQKRIEHGWRTFNAGETIPLAFLDASIAVDDIFAIDEM